MSGEQGRPDEQQASLMEVRLQPGVDLAGMDGVVDRAASANSKAESTTTASGAREGAAQRGVIWTPRFILLFGLMVVVGLSLESVLTQGWLNLRYTGQWIFQAHVALVAIAMLVLLVWARARWVRVGAIFGLAWAVFMTIDIVVQVLLGIGALDILGHVNVLICLSLLGCSICLTIDRFPQSRWDAWVLGLLPLVGVAATGLLFLLARDHSLLGLESTIATVALVLSAIAWLLRPSCWRAAPALTILFVLIPVILLGLDIENGGYNAVNFFLARVVLSASNNVSLRETNFFFSQVAILCLLLGATRQLKCELAN